MVKYNCNKKICQYNFSLKIEKNTKFYFPYQELLQIMKVNLYFTTLEDIDVLITEEFTV